MISLLGLIKLKQPKMILLCD